MRRPLLFIALIVLAAGATFANTLPNGFHLDDHYRIVDNPGLDAPLWKHFVSPDTMSTLERLRAYRPLLPFTLALNRAIAGDSLAGYHLANLLFQVLAAILFFLLARELLRDERLSEEWRDLAALAAAGLFAVHPVSGILVNYLCARDQILMEVFLLAALLLYVQLPTRGGARWRWPLALCCMALSLLSKTDAAMLPILVVAWELTLGGAALLSWRPWLRALPFAAVALAFVAFTRLVLHFSDLAQIVSSPASPWEYPLTQSRLHLFRYLRNFAWPWGIVQDPLITPATGLFQAEVLLGVLFILGSLGLAFALRRRAAPISFAILAYWILIAPTSSVVPLYQLAVDYRPYPGSPFLFLALALPLARLGRPLIAVALPVLLFSAGASVELNRTWLTDESLWMHSINHGGGALAHLNLAMAFRDGKDPRVQKNLRAALAINPNFVIAHLNLGLAMINAGEREAGLAECRRAVEIEPGWAQSRHWLSRAYTLLGRAAEAEVESGRAVALEPGNPRYRRQAALDAQAAGHDAAAVELATTTLQLLPRDAELFFLRGFSQQRLGRTAEAIADYRHSLALDPRNGQVRFNLATVLAGSGGCAEAVPLFQAVLASRPELKAGHLHLARCFTALGDPEHARLEQAAYDCP